MNTQAEFDAAIIGVGQAGNPLASKLISEGCNIAVIEKDLEGGSCINYGCTPTKAMISSAKTAYIVKNAGKWGIKSQGYETDFKEVINRRNEIVNKFRKSTTDFLEGEENITFFRGTASFAGKNSLSITSKNGKHQQIKADKIFVNTGSVPQIPGIDGLENIDYITSKNWVELESVPKELSIIGGGYIGLEFAQMFSRLGSNVTLFQTGNQLMLREDEDVADALKNILEDEGIDIHLNAQVTAVKKTSNQQLEISYKKNNKTSQLNATHLLIAAGTAPATKDLELQKAGIETDEKGNIQVNDRLETSVKGIYALGDVKGGPEFTHIAYDDFRILDDHLFGDGSRKLSDRPVPYTLFTDPQLGRIGLNEKMAKKQNISYRLASFEAKYVARAVETGKDKGLLKVLISEDDSILGASLLMDQGGEIMGALQIAMMGNLKYQELRDGVFAHPTYVEGLNNLFSTV